MNVTNLDSGERGRVFCEAETSLVVCGSLTICLPLLRSDEFVLSG